MMDVTVIDDLKNTGQTKIEGADIFATDYFDESLNVQDSEIRKFFAGASILITGGTGFLGKLMIEKLLRYCPELKKIYMLTRPKKNKEPEKRIQEQFDDVLYEKLKKQRQDFMGQVTIVEGDIGQKGLGLSDEDRKMLINEVDIIFHGAATVRFDEKLKTSVEINVRGTRELLILARQTPKLRAFVHTSTAYSHCYRKYIEETFYEGPIPGDKLIDMVESLDEQILNNITQGLLGEFPNTYAFTKAVAEDIVRQYSTGLPVAMIRPAIVIGTNKEPIPGWIDNVYGPTGVVVGAAVGLLHALYCKGNILADLVPGDNVVNCTIAAAYHIATTKCNNKESAPTDGLPPVFNYVSSEENPLTWERFMHLNVKNGEDCPTSVALWEYFFYLIPNKQFYLFFTFLFHWIPAYIVDGLAGVFGKEKMLVKAYTKIHKFSDVISYFCMQQWKFDNKNTQQLHKQLNKADQEIFNFDMSSLHWEEYFTTYIRGVRVFLLKDPMETIPQGIKKKYRLKVAHYVLSAILLALLFKLFSMVFRLIF